jgi:hypothetical protein
MPSQAARKSGPHPIAVVAQVREAFRPRARLAALLGALLGGFVPLATYTLAHDELASLLSVQAVIVAGGLLFSARTVVAWARLAFASPAKAIGFTVLLEGVMTLAHTPWLALAALAYLIGINAIATGTTLALAGRR